MNSWLNILLKVLTILLVGTVESSDLASDIEVSSSQSPRGGVRFLDITLDDLVRDKDAHVGVENGHRTDTEEDINRLVENLQSLTRNVQDYDEEQEGSEVDEKVIDSSPTGRFVKLNVEIGRGSFKTVYKGRDSETGATGRMLMINQSINTFAGLIMAFPVLVAWCELTVSRYILYGIFDLRIATEFQLDKYPKMKFLDVDSSLGIRTVRGVVECWFILARDA